jgi:hypothetical protein
MHAAAPAYPANYYVSLLIGHHVVVSEHTRMQAPGAYITHVMHIIHICVIML